MNISDLFLFFSLAVVVLWTLRLARSKGRNPWLWGGVALLLMFLPSWPSLLAMGPMVLLLFLKSPQTRERAGPNSITCSRCQTNHLASYRFCINCGWELRRPYEEGAADQVTQTSGHSSPANNKVEQVRVPTVPRASQEAPAPPPEPEEPVPPPPEPVAVEEEPPPPSRPRPKGVIPTAMNLTERGMSLFDQGRFQEAVDQFTKAIALDPNYKPAWAQRAEAYGRLGRSKEAAEDVRRLQAI